MLASPAHLYMPRLFTHCLPTIICVMLMSYVCVFLWYVTFLCDSILACLCTYFVFRSSFPIIPNSVWYMIVINLIPVTRFSAMMLGLLLLQLLWNICLHNSGYKQQDPLLAISVFYKKLWYYNQQQNNWKLGVLKLAYDTKAFVFSESKGQRRRYHQPRVVPPAVKMYHQHRGWFRKQLFVPPA